MKKDFVQERNLLHLVSPGNYKEEAYACLACGHKTDERSPICSQCGAIESLAPEENQSKTEQLEKRRRAKVATDIPARKYVPTPTGKPAWDVALGGGLVRPSTVLVHGPKGTGKTSALLTIATTFALRLDGVALYGTSEMSDELLRHYAERLGALTPRLLISDAGDAENILTDIEEFRPVVVVWDSIQAFTWEGQTGEYEMRSVLREGIRASHRYDLTSLFVSQVTKDNDFVGPSELGHNVDVIVELERKKDVLYVQCPSKNRFAQTPLVGEEVIE
jgi:DNA repair protein RadA/Sms